VEKLQSILNDLSTWEATQGTPEPQHEARGKPSAADGLAPNDWKILRALDALKAFDSERATTRPKITKQAKVGNHDSKSNQESFARLSDLELIDARRNVGTWLTSKGADLIATNKLQ
jgi:hypothetical protein